MDEAMALPTEQAVKIALRTQQILAHECGLVDVIDPLAGSWFIESLTNAMEAEAEKIFKAIDDLGGMVAAIHRGYPQREIAKAAFQFQRDVEEGRYVTVGVNEHVEKEEKPLPILKIDPAVERDQVAELRRFKESRDGIAVKRALEAVQGAARGKENLMARIVAAVKARATLGEIIETLKKEFGEWREPPIYW
jgi:methylmalonyl-CoA mutase N-terminal domain/subunit